MTAAFWRIPSASVLIIVQVISHSSQGGGNCGYGNRNHEENQKDDAAKEDQKKLHRQSLLSFSLPVPKARNSNYSSV